MQKLLGFLRKPLVWSNLNKTVFNIMTEWDTDRLVMLFQSRNIEVWKGKVTCKTALWGAPCGVPAIFKTRCGAQWMRWALPHLQFTDTISSWQHVRLEDDCLSVATARCMYISRIVRIPGSFPVGDQEQHLLKLAVRWNIKKWEE